MIKIPLPSQPIPKPPKGSLLTIFFRIVAIPAPSHIYLSGSKVPSAVDQSFEIDLLQRSVNTDAKSPREQKFVTSPGYEILSNAESQQQRFEADNEFWLLMYASRYSEKSQSKTADRESSVYLTCYVLPPR